MITLAKNSGFCFGVSNAVNKTVEILFKNKSGVYALGSIVHNDSTIHKLERLGLVTVDNIDQIPNDSIVIIRAHGVAPDIYQKCKEKNLKIFDLTCPKVEKVHKLVLENNNNFIILIGKKTHPEVIGTTGYAKNYFVIEKENDIDELKQKLNNYNGLVNIFTQTTFSVNKFNILVDLIKKNITNELKITSCICPSTENRQNEVAVLTQNNDLVVVVGGKNSSNTEKLFNIAKKYTNALWIETKDELNLDIVKSYDNIAIVSGASTSKDDVNDVYNFIS